MFATPRRMLQLAPNQYIYNHISKHIYKYTYIYIYVYTDTHRTENIKQPNTNKIKQKQQPTNDSRNAQTESALKADLFPSFVFWSSLDVRGSKFQWTFLSKSTCSQCQNGWLCKFVENCFPQWPQVWPHSQILSFMFLNPHVRNLNTMWKVKRRIGAGTGGEGAKILPWWTMDTAGEIESLHQNNSTLKIQDYKHVTNYNNKQTTNPGKYLLHLYLQLNTHAQLTREHLSRASLDCKWFVNKVCLFVVVPFFFLIPRYGTKLPQ